VKKAGDLLAAILDEASMKKARQYGNLFSSGLWSNLLESCGLERGFSHSRIAELEKSVLLVEADHPGWIQLLQTKQKELLNVIRRRFPELALTGISFRLSRQPMTETADQAAAKKIDTIANTDQAVIMDEAAAVDQIAGDEALHAIQDETLRNTLQKLGQRIRERAAGKTP
jgi:hypothetical protein